MSNVAALDKQGVFNTVVLHLAQQGGPARNDDGHCLYRAPLGRKCAAGAVLPDDKYDPIFEGATVTSNLDLRATFEAAGYNIDLLSQLQRAHDEASHRFADGGPVWVLHHELNGIASKLAGVAYRHGLNDDVLRSAFPEPAAAA